MQDPYRCLEITVLKKSRCEEARQLLDRVAKQVQPIMRKRRWTVKKVRCDELGDSKCGPGTACPVSTADGVCVNEEAGMNALHARNHKSAYCLVIHR
jgi:hypothetical protein